MTSRRRQVAWGTIAVLLAPFADAVAEEASPGAAARERAQVSRAERGLKLAASVGGGVLSGDDRHAARARGRRIAVHEESVPWRGSWVPSAASGLPVGSST
jgi:hypothetical protein